MLRWYNSVWSQVSDAELQSLYYSTCTERAHEVWIQIKHHPDHSPRKTFQECLVEEMAWRWMQQQPDLSFTPATQDVDAYV